MRLMKQYPTVLTLVALLATASFGQSYDPPPTYYSTATGTGATLKSQLHNIIDDHAVISYQDARFALQVTDEDPNNASRIILVYNRLSVAETWDPLVPVWNREHTWPESRLEINNGSGGKAVSDLFNLRPSTTSVNSIRGNLHFGGAYGQSFGVKTDKGATVWYPGDADAGMIARQEFYMAVRYDGSDTAADLELVNGITEADGRLGDMARMIEWHFAAVPDSFERRRNQVIYDTYQHNRNPFTDRPEFVWSVFVNQTNDSALTLQGGTTTAGGASTLDVNLGRVLVGASVPAGQNITLSKGGLNGTYYSVTTTGAATSSVTGRYNAFATGATGSKTINVGLATSTSTATPGLRSGTVTIDNLDVTTAGGAGRGANDGNDVANVNLGVLSHANPSFVAGTDVNALSYDFGTIALGGPAASFTFDIFNLETTAGFTAGLDLDSIVGSGATSSFATTLAPFMGAATLPAGTGYGFTADLETDVAGVFSATYTLNFSDENLPGAASVGSMTLTLSGVVAAVSENADFNGDGMVDGGDFLVWQRGVNGPASLEAGDANDDGVVNGLDLAIWKEQFGTIRESATAAIPEPAAIAILGVALLGLMWARGANFGGRI